MFAARDYCVVMLILLDIILLPTAPYSMVLAIAAGALSNLIGQTLTLLWWRG